MVEFEFITCNLIQIHPGEFEFNHVIMVEFVLNE